MSSNLKSAPLIHLSKKIGSGNERICWAHPNDYRLCIKTTKPEKMGKMGRSQNNMDYHYYQHLLSQKTTGPHLPQVHGWCNTNRGPGLVVDKVVWSEKNASVSLVDAFMHNWISLEQAESMIHDAFSWYLHHNVLITDYSPPHLVIHECENGKPCLSMVDGVGGRRFGFKYTLQRKFTFLARHKTRQVYRQALERTRFHYQRIKMEQSKP